MLPDLSPTHIIIVVIVALIVVGPKDLPALLRKIGQFMGRLRGLANEFRASFDEMARQSELDELRREVEAMRSATAQPLQAATSEFETYMKPIVDAAEPAHAYETAPDVAASAPSILPPAATPPIKTKAKAKSATSKSAAPKPAAAKGAPKTTKPKPKPKAKAKPAGAGP